MGVTRLLSFKDAWKNLSTLQWTETQRLCTGQTPADSGLEFPLTLVPLNCLNNKIFYGYFLIVEYEKKCQSFKLFFSSCSQFCAFIKICGYQFLGIFEKHAVNSWTVVALPIKSVVVFPS